MVVVMTSSGRLFGSIWIGLCSWETLDLSNLHVHLRSIHSIVAVVLVTSDGPISHVIESSIWKREFLCFSRHEKSPRKRSPPSCRMKSRILRCTKDLLPLCISRTRLRSTFYSRRVHPNTRFSTRNILLSEANP